LFSKGFDELISDKKQLTRDKIDFESLGLARQIIEDILMARYQFDTEGEKLFFEVNRFTKLNYASSGQQESIWILLLIFLLILDNQQVFIVLEEPEAHLYPKTQKKIVELMSLLAGLQQNQIVITTHSPYILSSFNNLIYAHTLGQVNTEAVNKLVNQRIWTDPSRVGAFALSDGKLINIIDEDVQLIQAEAIDSASDEINDTYHALFELDNVE
jgi:ABC-type multidrug transport system ATPase subunit